MTKQPANISCNNKSFDFRFAKNNVEAFTFYLCKENCRNPMIAYYARRVLLDYFQRMKIYDPIEFIEKEAKHYSRDQISDNVRYLERMVPPGLPRYYNHYNTRFLFAESDAAALNTEWYSALSLLYMGIIRQSLQMILFALKDICNSFRKTGVSFDEFMKFDGIFSRCKFLANVHPDKEAGFFSDMFYYFESYTDACPEGWKIIIRDDSHLRTILSDSLKTLGTLKMNEMGADDFQAAFKCLIYGEEINSRTFEVLENGVKDANRLFDKNSPIIKIDDTRLKTCPYCKKPYPSKSKKQIYCSPHCRIYAHRNKATLVAIHKDRK